MIVVLGDFVQQAATQEDMSVTGGVIVVSTFVVWMVIGDLFARRSMSADRILSGERLRVDDLLGEAREAGYGRLDDIALGVLEADGKFSFVPVRHRPENRPGGSVPAPADG